MDTFDLFRPSSHFIAPHSWSNDPCGAVYVPETQEYLLCYQWNPGTTDGGNCAWGMARSKDLVTWEDCQPPIWNGPRGSYDSRGVFSGSIVAKSESIDGREQTVLYLFYTSVSGLPIHWSKPYIRGCETQSVAVSTDFGATWRKHEANPLIESPPHAPGATTGWRDPFVSQWSEMSKLLQLSDETYYMLISSGERGIGPQLHLYKSCDLLQWDYVCELLGGAAKREEKITPASDLTWGVNFECASFFELDGKTYLILGVEEEDTTIHHNGHHLIWLSGQLVLQEDQKSPCFKVEAHNNLDFGLLYAAHIFHDAEGRLIQLGWADEQANQTVVKSQGWAGCLGHPREIFRITKPLDKNETSHKTSHAWALDEKSSTMETLGIRPASKVSALRGPLVAQSTQTLKDVRSAGYELSATLTAPSGQERVTFKVCTSVDMTEFTGILVDLSRGLVVVDRSQSSLARLNLPHDMSPAVDKAPFDIVSGEDLSLRIYADKSMVEVFVNDRVALTSRVYPTLATSTGIKCHVLIGDEDITARMHIQCWEVTKSAWPSRDAGIHVLEELNPLRQVELPTKKLKSREMEVPIEILA